MQIPLDIFNSKTSEFIKLFTWQWGKHLFQSLFVPLSHHVLAAFDRHRTTPMIDSGRCQRGRPDNAPRIVLRSILAIRSNDGVQFWISLREGNFDTAAWLDVAFRSVEERQKSALVVV
jgi:hypothetical protein